MIRSHWLGLWVSWVNTKIQAFNDILDVAVLFVPVCGEDVEVMERFTYLGSDIHVSAGCEPEVTRRLDRAWRVMDSLDHAVWRCRYLFLAPTLLSTCMDWSLGRISERSSCSASFGNVKISDLDFANVAVIFAETLEIRLGALEVLNEELEPLGLWVSWVKTKLVFKTELR